VTLVDAKNVVSHLREKKADDAVNEAVQQIAFADRIVLNKLDLVNEAELAAIKEEILSINHTAKMIETRRSVVDLSLILDQKAFSLDHCTEIDPDILDGADEDEQEECHDENCTVDHDHKHHDHDHDHAAHAAEATPEKKKRKKKRHDLSQVASVGFKFPGNFDVPKFNMFMSTLLQAKAADIYRSKGILSFAGQGNTKFVFQGVHETINFGPSKNPWGDDEERVSKIVFIGRGLNRAELHAGLEKCLAPN